MRIVSLPVLLFFYCALTLIGSVFSTQADETSYAKQPKIYDESADGNKQVADAIVIAKRERKRILLEFGANWCVWCHRLHDLFESDKSVSAELKADYVVALIDVNKGHNEDLVVKYGAKTGYGLPFLVLLDSDGTHLVTKHSDDFEEGDHHNPQKVLAFLKAPLLSNTPKSDR
jgi:thiol:disulfide interchange protein